MFIIYLYIIKFVIFIYVFVDIKMEKMKIWVIKYSNRVKIIIVEMYVEENFGI